MFLGPVCHVRGQHAYVPVCSPPSWQSLSLPHLNAHLPIFRDGGPTVQQLQLVFLAMPHWTPCIKAWPPGICWRAPFSPILWLNLTLVPLFEARCYIYFSTNWLGSVSPLLVWTLPWDQFVLRDPTTGFCPRKTQLLESQGHTNPSTVISWYMQCFKWLCCVLL